MGSPTRRIDGQQLVADLKVATYPTRNLVREIMAGRQTFPLKVECQSDAIAALRSPLFSWVVERDRECFHRDGPVPPWLLADRMHPQTAATNLQWTLV